jgi:hypothetical protein
MLTVGRVVHARRLNIGNPAQSGLTPLRSLRLRDSSCSERPQVVRPVARSVDDCSNVLGKPRPRNTSPSFARSLKLAWMPLGRVGDTANHGLDGG